MLFKKAISLFLCFCLCVLPSVSCNSGAGEKTKEPQTQARSYYEFFDTVSVIFSYLGDPEEEFYGNCNAVSELLGEYHKLFDIYYEYSGINNIKTINKNAGISPVEVDEKLIDFLTYCKELYAITDGRTNVAMGSVLKLWHDCREEAEEDISAARIPSEDELTEAAKHCDIDSLIIDKAAGTVYISDPDMSLDVGAVGKGYATEKAAKLLIDRGVTSYVLNIGGNIRAIGEKVTGSGWVTGITNPNKLSSESFVCKVSIKDVSLVTSGDYERYYTVDGVKYHHIIDPDTLMPADYFTSVSVFTPDSGFADALSTALFCMSYEDGRALAESLGNVEVIWVDKEYNVKHTDGVVFAE